MDRATAIGQRNGRWAGGVGMAVGAAFAAALIGLANAPMAGAEGGALDTAVDNFLQGIANDFAPEFNEGSLGDPDAFCLTFFQCMDGDQMIDSLYQAINTDFQPEGPIDNFFDQLLGTAPAADPAQALDMQISIGGMDLFPTAGNTATATSDSGDIAIAIGNGADANATNGTGDFAFADGTDSRALAISGNLDTASSFGTGSEAFAESGNNDTATAVGTNSEAFSEAGNDNLASAVNTGSALDTAQAGGVASFLGSNDTAFVLGTGSTALAGADLSAAGNFDLGAAFGDLLNSTGATGGNFLVDILTPFGAL